MCAKEENSGVTPAGWRMLRVVCPAVLLGAIGVLVWLSNQTATPHVWNATSMATPPPERAVDSLDELLQMSPEELATVDIAEMNLLCGQGLPGAETLDINHCLATLDQWAKRVNAETTRTFHRLSDPRYQEETRGSEPYFRMLCLLTVLQRDLGVKYDLSKRNNFLFTDSKVAFLHGMIPGSESTAEPPPGGTCASMPIMYIAVGRRLGYPLKLVTTRSHLFVRWDGMDHPNPKWRERINIEGSGRGLSSFDDEYYTTWPSKVSDAEIKRERYLVNLTPTEELAVFLAARGHCLFDNNKLREAKEMYAAAAQYDPSRSAYRGFVASADRRINPRWQATPRQLAAQRQQQWQQADRINRENRERIQRTIQPHQNPTQPPAFQNPHQPRIPTHPTPQPHPVMPHGIPRESPFPHPNRTVH